MTPGKGRAAEKPRVKATAPTSGAAGVWKRANGRHVAVVYRGESTAFAGTWETWKEAAIARDRAIRFLGYTDQRLNFPGL